MEGAIDEQREGGGASTEVNDTEAELTEENTHNNLKGTSNGVMEGEEEELNGDRVGGGVESEGGGGDLSSINAMMSAVMSAAGTINGGGAGVDSAHTPSSGPSPSPSPNKSVGTPTRTPTASRNARRNQETTTTKDDGKEFICPLCDKNCMTQHNLTMHIRQHNADAGATDHSCSICGKALSSASSLDRHMLVHSGERPYKCNNCGQTFTTNGNMHRHMKIHEKDPSTVSLSFTPPSPTKRRRPSAKRRLEEEKEEPPSKKVPEESVVEEKSPVQQQKIEEYVRCPICFQTCTSRHDLDAHMDTHPDTTLRCDLCCVSFRTHRGLLRHNAAVHKLLPQDPMGRPFIQNNPSIPNGFNDLAFIDFSCNKFAHIAQVWCETNLRRCVSRFHRFVCDSCDKAFPLQSALDLHTAVAHPDQPAGGAAGEKAAEKLVETAAAQSHGLSAKREVLPPQQSSFLESLGLLHVSKVKLGPSEDQIRQSQLDSIKVIHVEPSSCAFPQEPASAYLSLGLGVGVGGLGALGGLGGLSLGIPIIEAAASASGKTTTTLQGLSQRDALSLLSLQPFQASFLVHPDGGASAASSGVKPGEGIGGGGAGIMELADIQQILKVAAAAPNQMGLPPLAKAPGYVIGGQGQVQSQKSMPPLKPKPPLTPRSSLTAHTPPPLQSSHQASLGCISPSLPPPIPTLFKIPSSSSSSSSSSGSGGSQMEAECMGDVAHTPSSGSPSAQEEAGLGGKKSGGGKGGGVSANGGSAKGSFPCRFCEQVFPFSGVLQAHMRFHLGVLPHQCNICDYVAPDKATLIRHLRTHSGERPYVCRVCHYPFTVKANCERHLRKKHAKTSRKEIEKNIKYVTSAASMGAITQDGPGLETSGTTGSETVCRFCGDDLKTYRALQIHLRTHNGCQKKPFECRRCGAAFLAKRNCIHHLLKQHPEVQEKEIEDHIATLLPAAAAPAPPAAITVATAAAVPVAAATSARSSPACLPAALTNGLNAAQNLHHQIKVEESLVYSAATDLDQPLDFSAKGRRVGGVGMLPGVKLEELSPGFQCLDPDQPIDLSIPSKRQRREVEGGTASVEKEIKIKIKTEPGSASSTEPPPQQQQQQQPQQQHHGLGLTKVLQVEERNASILPPLHPHPQPGCYQLPPGSTPPTPACLSGLQNNPARALRLKPLLPKPASSSSTYSSASAVVSSIVSSSSSSSSLKELPPLASIAQIISSVSGATELLKTREAGSLDGKAPQGGLATSSSQVDSVVVPEVPGTTASPDTQTEETKPRPARKRSRKRARAAKEKAVVNSNNNTGSGIDLESSGEFASVERMLATTDANKFSTYLQTGAADLGTKRHPDRHGGVEEAGGEDGKPTVLMPQSKGKKNAYSNSVQKMTCPFCPRVFPWASSLQRHMLTHTGQKPYPCPNCDAFFSTKSNCERHLLRKHGVTNRSMRRNGSLKKDGEEGSHDSDSQSDSEQANPEAVDLSGSATESRSTLDLRRSSDSPRAVHVGRVTRSSPASRPSQGASPSPSFTDESGTDSSVIMDHLQGAAENKAAQPPQNNCKMDADEDDEDSQSNKSLDLNFASKLIDFTSSFTFSSSTPAPTCSAADQRPSHTSTAVVAASALPPTPSTAPGGAASQSTGGEEKEKPSALASLTPAVKPAPEYKHVCRVCKKSFRYATTLARHERAHLSEETPAPPPVAAATTAAASAAAGEEESEKAEERNAAAKDEENKTTKVVEAEEQDRLETTEREAKGGGESEGGESGESEDEDEEEEKERSDDEGGASEPKKEEGGEGGESRVDKRKKICNVCGKRFWSMQDLTRHMRSHTGERPYQCQTCERTFTLKHSLVRHQRIHLKPRGDPGMSSAPSSTGCHDDGSEDGDLSCTPTSTCPPSENESEGGGGGIGGEGKELDEGEEEEDEDENENDQESSKEAETNKPKPSVDQSQASSGSVPLEAGLESPAAEGSTSEPASGSESTPGSSFGSESPPEPRSDEPAEPTAESETASRKATATETPGERQASDSTAAGPSSSSSKDPSSSSSHSSSSPGQAPVASAAPTEGFIQGLLEIHAQPHLEHILPGGEPPLVGVE